MKLLSVALILLAVLPAGRPARAADADPIPSLRTYTYGQSRTNLAAVEALVRAATADPRLAPEVERRLLAVLQSDATFDAKQFVCRQLRVIGSEAAAPILALLLNDPKLSHPARYALEGMPSPAAGSVLRRASQTALGEPLVGIVNSLGERREAVSTPVLIPLLSSRDLAVVQATITALGKIGGDVALDALRAVARHYDPSAAEGVTLTVALSEDARLRLDVTVLADAFLRCADRFSQDGNIEFASEIYARLHGAGVVPRPQQIAALNGLTRVAPERATPILLKLLRGSDAPRAGLAASLVRWLPAEAASQLAALWEGLPAAQQVLLLEALSDRREPALLFHFLRASLSPDPAVRLAGLRALGDQEGNRDAVQLLAGVAVAETGELGATARASLDRLRGGEVDPTLIAMVSESNVGARAEAVRSLAARRAQGALPALTKALNDANAPVRLAALDALGVLGGPPQVSMLLDYLAQTAGDAERSSAAKAVVAVCRRIDNVEGRTRPVLDALDAASEAAKGELLSVLGQLGGAPALQAVAAAARAADAGLRARAVEALASWPDPAALDELLAIARTAATPAQRTVALRGSMQMIEATSNLTPPQRFERYQTAWAIATTPDDKRLVLGGLANVPDLAALKLAEPLVTDPELKNEAGLAVARIARAVAATSPQEARAAVDKVLAAAPSPPVLAEARKAVDHFERAEDFVTAWRLAGPYTQGGASEKELFEVEFGPEKGDGAVVWRPAAAEAGAVPLDQLIGGDNRVAYVRTTLVNPGARKAQLQFGSDDGVKVWLNGKVVLARNVTRGYTPGEDKVEVDLNEGRNVLLVKVTQGSGGWTVGCRVRAVDGTKLAGVEFKAE